jgi:hypothetical protein
VQGFPLDLTLRVMPAESDIHATATLVATLKNPTDGTLVVNRRMLLNHAGAPGEIWLDVDGPAGYRNMRGFHVRAGRAPNELFVPLAPGASVEQRWNLDDYESLHVPGDYRVTATYHNEDPFAPDGRPMPVGQTAATATLRRHG